MSATSGNPTTAWGTHSDGSGYVAFCTCGWRLPGFRSRDAAESAVTEHRSKIHPEPPPS